MPRGPGSPLPDPGSVQRLALRLNERIASEERSRGTTPRRSLSPSPLVSPHGISLFIAMRTSSQHSQIPWVCKACHRKTCEILSSSLQTPHPWRYMEGLR